MVESSEVERPLLASWTTGWVALDVENTLLVLLLTNKDKSDKTHPLSLDGACTLAATGVRTREAANGGGGGQSGLFVCGAVLLDPATGKEAHSGCRTSR